MKDSFSFRHHFRFWLLIISSLALFSFTSSVEATVFYRAQKIIRLTDLNPSADGTLPMSVTGLNAAGRVTGYFPSSNQNKLHAFVWDDATQMFTDLNTPLNADSSMATCVNAAGQVAGIFWALDGHYTQTAFIWQPDGTITTFVPSTGGMMSSINAINDAGNIIGTYILDDGSTRGFFFAQANGQAFVDLGDLGETGNYIDYIWPSALNNSDQVSGFIVSSPAERHLREYTSGFLWRGGALNVVDASVWSSEIVALNDAGSLVGLYGTGGLSAPFSTAGSFFWDGRINLTDLGDLGGGNGASVFALTPDGVAVGTSLGSDSKLHLFSWGAGGNPAIVDQGVVSLFAGDASFRPYSIGLVTGVVDGNGESVYDLTGFGTDANDNPVPLLWKDGSIYNVSNLLPTYLSFRTISSLYGSQVLINSREQIACAGTRANGQQVALLLSLDLDTDNDGLPDSWEVRYFGHLSVDPNADPDGDGLTNLQEYEQGTDPTWPEGVPPFDPIGLVLHLDAGAAIVASGSVISQWGDISGFNHDAVQANTANQPMWVANALNGRPVVRFSGNQSFNLPDFMSTAKAGEMVIVLKSTAAGGLCDFGTSGYDVYSDSFEYGRIFSAFGSDSSYYHGEPLGDIGQFNIYETCSQPGSWKSWFNGVSFFPNTHEMNAPDDGLSNVVAFNQSPKLGINGYGYNFSGDIAEVLVYNRALNPTERKSIQAYLTCKYALTSAPPTPTGVTALKLSPAQICVTWNTTSAGVPVDYILERASSVTGPFVTIATLDSAGTYLDDSPAAAQSPCYRVMARNGAGQSAVSTVVTVPPYYNAEQNLPKDDLRLWLIADEAPESPVGRWPDHSGNGNDAYQESSFRRPTIAANAINGRPAVRFEPSPHFDDTTAEYFVLPNFMNEASAGEMIVVLKGGGGLGSFGVNSMGTLSGWGEFYPGTSDFGSRTSHNEGTTPEGVPGQFNLYDVSSQPGLWQSWMNGSPYFTSTVNTVGFTSQPVLGASQNKFSGFQGDIAEVLVYARVLTPAERSAVDYYLAAKYLLPNTDPDQDGLTTKQELAIGTDPLNPDTNGDGINDKQEYISGLSPTIMDMDGDGISNAQELINGTNPFDADTDHDGVPDNLDYYPLDPTRSQPLPQTPGVPVLTLSFPPGVALLP